MKALILMKMNQYLTKQDVKPENDEYYLEDDDLFDNEYKRNTTIHSAYWLGIDIVEIDIKRFDLYNFDRLLDKDYNKYQTDTNIHRDPLNDVDEIIPYGVKKKDKKPIICQGQNTSFYTKNK